MAVSGGSTQAAFHSSSEHIGPRTTGFASLPFVEWGANICIFFESKADSLAAMVAYFRAGLASHEKCLWEISDPITERGVRDALLVGIPNYEKHILAGDLAIDTSVSWNLGNDEVNLQRITGRLPDLLSTALNTGYAGLRIGGNATWSHTHNWKDVCHYEEELGRSVVGKKIVLLCAQSPGAEYGSALDEPARAKHAMIYRGEPSGFVDMHAMRRHVEDSSTSMTSDHSTNLFEKYKFVLTAREREVLALVVNGVSSKQGAQLLGISRRTIEFHRSNIMQKLEVRNVAELVQAVLRNGGDTIGHVVIKATEQSLRG